MREYLDVRERITAINPLKKLRKIVPFRTAAG